MSLRKRIKYTIQIFSFFSYCPSVQAQPGQVPRPDQYGRRPDQDEQSGGSHQGLPEAAHSLQADPGQDV